MLHVNGFGFKGGFNPGTLEHKLATGRSEEQSLRWSRAFSLASPLSAEELSMGIVLKIRVPYFGAPKC